MFELDVREFRRDGQRLVHEAERRREDDRAARAGEALDGALGVRAFRHVLEEGGLDLVAEFLVDHLPADVVRLGPAAVRLGAYIEKAGLDLLLRNGRHGRRNGEGRGQPEKNFLHLSSVLSG